MLLKTRKSFNFELTASPNELVLKKIYKSEKKRKYIIEIGKKVRFSEKLAFVFRTFIKTELTRTIKCQFKIENKDGWFN